MFDEGGSSCPRRPRLFSTSSQTGKTMFPCVMKTLEMESRRVRFKYFLPFQFLFLGDEVTSFFIVNDCFIIAENI